MEFGLSDAFVDTPKAHQRRVLISLGCNSGTPFLPESEETCQHNFDSFPATARPRAIGHRETTSYRRDAAACTRSRCQIGAGPILITVADRENLGSAKIATVSAAVSDEAEWTDELLEWE